MTEYFIRLVPITAPSIFFPPPPPSVSNLSFTLSQSFSFNPRPKMEPDRAAKPMEAVVDSDSSHTPPEHDIESVVKNENASGQNPANDGEYRYDYPTGLKLASILAGATMAYYLLFLDLAIISTATPAITTEFDALIDIGWYSGAYQLASAALQPLSGKIYTYFSLKVCRLSPLQSARLTEPDSSPVDFSCLLLRL